MRINLRAYADRYGCTLPAKYPDVFALLRAWVLQCDYSQLENRIIALLAGDRTLLKWYADGLDVHSLTAASLYNLDFDTFMQRFKEKDPRIISYRGHAKTVRYGFQYMGSAATIWGQLVVKSPNVTLQQVEFMCSQMREMHPDITRYHKANIKSAEERGYLEVPLSGRRLYFHGLVDITLIANWPMQTTGADIINERFIDWSEERDREIAEGLKWREYERPIAQVHDSIVLSTCNPIGSLDRLKRAMEKPAELGGNSLPFPIDAELGVHFGPDAYRPSKDDKPGQPTDYGLREVRHDNRQELFEWMLECGMGAGILYPLVG